MCDTALTSATTRPDARTLLDGGPDEYIARRDALAKELKAGGDKDGASAIKSLVKPTMAMWAVLAAGDADLARAAMDATTQLVAVQGRAADRAAITSATAARRKLIDQLVDRGMSAIGRGNEARAQEVRDLLERLTRQPHLLDEWIDGTLRTVPEEGLGFDAFAGFEPPVSSASAPRQERPTTRPARSRGSDEDAPADEVPRAAARASFDERAAQEQERAEREAARARRVAAKAELLAAEKAVASANRQLDVARRAKQEADRAFDRAAATADAAERRVEAARAAMLDVRPE